ncbi:DeoR/GlpR family DNA-binding transcription regulator [Streptomyces sp. cg40]|uniref:DeoR/GlpR family DNA-binding transcription regulator n=1 Tax=Streptomyces sp. cg40 TaxID=3419764 RepID=UPI003CFD74CA
MKNPEVGAIRDRGPGARREQVRAQVLAQGSARLDELAARFDVSLMTMHRDVDALEAEGWLIKTRGAATANPSALAEAGVRDRMSAMSAEKAAITAEASRLITRGQTVFLDDSTTALGLVPSLVSHPPMTIATNFLPVIAEIGEVPGVQIQLLGGEYHARQEACFGRQAIEAIALLSADVFFMSTTAVRDGKCLHRSEATVMVRQAFMAHASRRVLLVDHAKFGRRAAHVLCDVSEFDIVVTDDGIDAETLADLRASCADVRVASVGD